MAARGNSILSVVVTIASDTIREPSVDHIRSCLHSLIRQTDPSATEIIVPHQPGYPRIEELQREFPQVRFLEFRDLKRYTGQPGTREHHNELRTLGIKASTGSIVALTEDHAIMDSNWCAQIVDAHSDPAISAVGGAIENSATSLLSWAVYFRDFGTYQNPVRRNESSGPSDVNVSYKRSALESIRPIWAETFEEQAVNGALRASGQQIVFSPRVIVYQDRADLDVRTAVRERWIWGRSYAAWRGLKGLSRVAWVGICLVVPLFSVARMAVQVVRKRRNVSVFITALPFIVLMAVAWSLGQMAGYISGPGSGNPVP